MSDKNTIVLNGKQYDAQTGAPIEGDSSAPEATEKPAQTEAKAPEPAPTEKPAEQITTAAEPEKPASPRPPTRYIDGIMRKPALPHTAVHAKPQVTVSTTPAPSVTPIAAPVAQKTPEPIAAEAKAPEPAHIEKPAEVVPVALAAPKPVAIEPPKPINVTGPKSDAITTPNHVMAHPRQQTQTLMRTAVQKPAPAFKRLVRMQAPVANPSLPTSTNLAPKRSIVDVARLGRAKVVAQSGAISRFGTATLPKFTKQVQPVPVQTAPKEAIPKEVIEAHAPGQHAIFETAIASATSHEQPPVPPSKRPSRTGRMINMAAGGVAILLIAGFVLYQNMPTLDLRMASAHAGFQAAMPNALSGFAYTSPMQYKGDEVTINFHSNTDARSYTVLEDPSTWDSQALLDNFVSTAAKTHQTVENGGNTIYIYNGEATWVNANIWYRIINHANLSSGQLISIASSL